MTSETTAAAVPRERGWGRVLVALAFVLIASRILGPLADALLFVIAVVAGLMIAAWRLGGSAFSALAWTLLAGWSLLQRPGGMQGLPALEGAFALVLGATYGTVTLARPGPFLTRALASVAIAVAVLALFVQTLGPGLARGLSLVRERYAESVRAVGEQFLRLATEQVRRGNSPEAAAQLTEVRAFVDLAQQRVPAALTAVAPALLALESLAILALGWALYHRFSRVRLGLPLSPLAEFRFPDGLVWAIVAGLAVVVTPGLAPIRGVAANLLVFFGTLYAVRGIGVLWFFTAPGPVATVLAAMIGLIFIQAVLPTAACIGLSDTWIDWRRRLAADTP
ncbi:MAG: DUF2232 domain-containing protein [Gemmatimonadota bacterium]|jgi:hypothetical protein|nr:YybS family protein [Gemmatimonadota bacterium]